MLVSRGSCVLSFLTLELFMDLKMGPLAQRIRLGCISCFFSFLLPGTKKWTPGGRAKGRRGVEERGADLEGLERWRERRRRRKGAAAGGGGYREKDIIVLLKEEILEEEEEGLGQRLWTQRASSSHHTRTANTHTQKVPIIGEALPHFFWGGRAAVPLGQTGITVFGGTLFLPLIPSLINGATFYFEDVGSGDM